MVMKWSKFRFSDLVAAATTPKSFQAVDSARFFFPPLSHLFDRRLLVLASVSAAYDRGPDSKAFLSFSGHHVITSVDSVLERCDFSPSMAYRRE